MTESDKAELTPEARAKLAEFGRKGGSAGSREDKSKAGKKGWRAMIKSVTQQQEDKPEHQPKPTTQEE